MIEVIESRTASGIVRPDQRDMYKGRPGGGAALFKQLTGERVVAFMQQLLQQRVIGVAALD